MSIRCCVKAIIIKEECLLVTVCEDPVLGLYYELPGGGQEPYETLDDALRRECLEETGCEVEPVRFVALFEEIFTDPDLRARYSDYAHRLYHFFLCDLVREGAAEIAGADNLQTGVKWMPLGDIATAPLHPQALRDSFTDLLAGVSEGFLGTGIVELKEATLA